MLLKDDNQAVEMQVDGSHEEPVTVDLRTPEEAESFNSVFMSTQNTGFSSVLLQANYSDETGCIEIRAGDLPDCVLKTL